MLNQSLDKMVKSKRHTNFTSDSLTNVVVTLREHKTLHPEK